MKKEAIKRYKSLRQQLMDMKISDSVIIDNKEFKDATVRRIIWMLNNSGYSFTASSRGIVDGINVTRLR